MIKTTPSNNPIEDVAQEVSNIVHRLHSRTFLDGDTPNMDYPDQAIKEITQLLHRERLKARIDDLEKVFPLMEEDMCLWTTDEGGNSLRMSERIEQLQNELNEYQAKQEKSDE